jgi:glycosyltransferase involved in cell wall biosynthesis
MRILFIVDPTTSVPPSEYGGAERIAGFLCSELQSLGHCVTLMAGPGSASFNGGTLIHHAPTSNRLSRIYRKLLFFIRSGIASCGKDVIINFGRLDYLALLLLTNKPLVCRFGNPVSQKEIDWLLMRRKENLRLIAVSEDQIRGLRGRELWSVVHNATDLSKSIESSIYGHLLFLGRITSNKGADTAIRVARRCGLRLILAGNISNEEGGAEFFEREIRPQLDSQIEWIGPVDDEAKQKLLAGAKTLLFPIRWPEPFGIVMIESFACGTPVIATRCASTPEVIDDGITGFLCDSEDELVAAVGRIAEIDRAACRKAAEERFSVPVMTQKYLRVIEELLTQEGQVSE